MANTKISALGSLSAVPATNDFLVIVDVSDTTQAASGTTKKIISDYFAFTGRQNTFTTDQTFSPVSTGSSALIINAASGATGPLLNLQYNSVLRGVLSALPADTRLQFTNFDNGSSFGPRVVLGRNSNASTPAAGHLQVSNLNGTAYRLWPDTSGIWRSHTADPTNAADTAGTVVGSQSSHADFKEVVGDAVSGEDALALIQAAVAQIKRFTYKNGAFNGQEFSGIILDGPELHRYGMDADEEHPAGKSLNMSNAIGDLMLAVAYLAEQMED